MSEKNLSAVRKRESRAKQMKRYHRTAFIAEYTQIKYRSIYEEAESFYEKLYKRYPTKTKITTCVEFKSWEVGVRKEQGLSTRTTSIHIDNSSSTTTPINPSVGDNIQLNIEMMDSTQSASIDIDNSSSTTSPINLRVDDNIQLNIELMDSGQVQETRDSLVFGDIYPSLIEEINPEILDQIIREIQGSDVNIFNYNESDQDINDILNDEINMSINELTPLEKELLKY